MREITITSRDILSFILIILVTSAILWCVGCFFWASFIEKSFFESNMGYKLSTIVGGALTAITSIGILMCAGGFVMDIWKNDRSFTFGGKKNSIPKVEVKKL